jgi:hypothetical protein
VLQALARGDWLRHVDYLSTVSGGGSIGAFLGRYFDSYRMRSGEPNPAPGVVQDRVARGLIDTDSVPLDWVRRHASYAAPGGAGDLAVSAVAGLRSLLSVYLVLGVLFLAVFGSIDAIRYLGDDIRRGGAPGALSSHTSYWTAPLLPLGPIFPDAWRGPWLALAEGALWLGVVPLMLAYWLVSQDRPESFVAPVLVSAAIAAGTLLLLTGSPLALAVLTASVLWSLASWAAAEQEEGPPDPRTPYRRMLAREHLNRRLTFWVRLTAAFVAVWAVDGAGRSLARRMPYGDWTLGSSVRWLAGAGALVLALAWILGAVARRLVAVSSRTGRPIWRGWYGLWPLAALSLGALPFLVAMSFVSHSMYGVGEDYTRGLAVTAVAAVMSVLFGTRECLPLINQSGSIAIRAGRIARTFSGAVNPARRSHPEGEDITRPVAGDSVPFDQYHPELVGGPLHLINCAVKATFDLTSFRLTDDRGAENLAVGPAGVSVSRVWHALWTGTVPLRGFDPSLEPLGTDSPDPFLIRDGSPSRVEPLALETWVAISGAKFAAVGRGRIDDGPARLRTVSGFRSGYWWDSGVDASERTETPIRGGLLAAFGAALARLFRGQTLLLTELAGKFGGPWTRHWYLTNGGVFESTGAYELLRRRVPFIIVCDASVDPERRGSAFAQFVRLARVDLGAEVTEAGPCPESLEQLGVPAGIACALGSIKEILSSKNEVSLKHAALLEIRYPDLAPGPGGDAFLARRRSWMLYIKTTYSGAEPPDVRSYAAAHPPFPDESTPDEAFDERQWESYRVLGEYIGNRVFGKQ